MKVYCYPASDNSKYVPLLFLGTQDRYQPIYRQQGSLADAIAELNAGRSPIVHIHWEEFVLNGCATDVEADIAADEFLTDIKQFHDLGGALFWTVHNEVPHEIGFYRQFLAMRTLLAREADVVLVHNSVSIETLAHQVALDRSKVRALPHASYLDMYEDGATLRAGLKGVPERRIQGFGWIRLQKGFGEVIKMLPPSFLAARGSSIRISGHGPEAGAVIAQQARRGDVQWDVRHVPDAEAPHLLRSAACVVLPYRRVLTSGVALLAMSVGALIVAVDTPQMRELLPLTNHRFLYPYDDAEALRTVISGVLDLPVGERQHVLEANLLYARSVHPRNISATLADLYDKVLSVNTRPH